MIIINHIHLSIINRCIYIYIYMYILRVLCNMFYVNHNMLHVINSLCKKSTLHYIQNLDNWFWRDTRSACNKISINNIILLCYGTFSYRFPTFNTIVISIFIKLCRQGLERHLPHVSTRDCY